MGVYSNRNNGNNGNRSRNDGNSRPLTESTNNGQSGHFGHSEVNNDGNGRVVITGQETNGTPPKQGE